ncbi:MAG: metal-dependent transcriptional regulator [Kiritimatiellia bacterium]|nr:metal-dependent transcriptional regulator [Kiritimatiellia bacterium]
MTRRTVHPRGADLSESQEDYLETILRILEDHPCVHASEIARRMEVSGASVTGALRVLARKRLVRYEPYAPVTLTPTGRSAARRIARRHAALRDFFLVTLRATRAEAERCACRLEHVLPTRLLDRIAVVGRTIQIHREVAS